MSKGKLVILVLILVALCGGAYYFLTSDPSAAAAKGSAQTASKDDGVESVPGELWSKRCEKEQDYCEVFQRLIIKENNQRLLEIAVGYPKDAQNAQAVIVLPLGIVIAEGILVRVDGGAPSKAMIRSCNQAGCYVVMNLPDTFLDSMKTGQKLVVGFLDGKGKQLNVEMGLAGFGSRLQEVAK